MTIEARPSFQPESPRDRALIALFKAKRDYLRESKTPKRLQAHPESSEITKVDTALSNLQTVNKLLHIPEIQQAIEPSPGKTVRIGSYVKSVLPTIRHELHLTKDGLVSMFVDNFGEPAEPVNEDTLRDWASDKTRFGGFKEAVKTLASFTPDRAIDSIHELVTQ